MSYVSSAEIAAKKFNSAISNINSAIKTLDAYINEITCMKSIYLVNDFINDIETFNEELKRKRNKIASTSVSILLKAEKLDAEERRKANEAAARNSSGRV